MNILSILLNVTWKLEDPDKPSKKRKFSYNDFICGSDREHMFEGYGQALISGHVQSIFGIYNEFLSSLSTSDIEHVVYLIIKYSCRSAQIMNALCTFKKHMKFRNLDLDHLCTIVDNASLTFTIEFEKFGVLPYFIRNISSIKIKSTNILKQLYFYVLYKIKSFSKAAIESNVYSVGLANELFLLVLSLVDSLMNTEFYISCTEEQSTQIDETFGTSIIDYLFSTFDVHGSTRHGLKYLQGESETFSVSYDKTISIIEWLAVLKCEHLELFETVITNPNLVRKTIDMIIKSKDFFPCLSCSNTLEFICKCTPMDILSSFLKTTINSNVTLELLGIHNRVDLINIVFYGCKLGTTSFDLFKLFFSYKAYNSCLWITDIESSKSNVRFLNLMIDFCLGNKSPFLSKVILFLSDSRVIESLMLRKLIDNFNSISTVTELQDNVEFCFLYEICVKEMSEKTETCTELNVAVCKFINRLKNTNIVMYRQFFEKYQFLHESFERLASTPIAQMQEKK